MTRTAPARLFYPLARPPRALGWGLAVLAGLAAAVQLLWLLQGAGPGPWPALSGLLLWLAACTGAWRCWRHWPQGRLEWDGAQWWLQRLHTARPGWQPLALRAAPQVCCDVQDWLLLRVSLPARRDHWLWLRRASAPASWGDLRRAVYWRADDLPA